MMEEVTISEPKAKRGRYGWRKRHSSEFNKSILIIGLLLAVAAVMIISSALERPGPSSSHAGNYDGNSLAIVNNVCYSAVCNESAAKILSFMNASVDPCEDFYDFVCGQYVENTAIPDDKAVVNMFTEVTDEVLQQLRSLVEESAHPDDPTPFKSIRYLYNACMDEEKVNSLGVEPMKKKLKQLGGWPLLDGDQWKETDFSWNASVRKFRQLGYSADFFIDLSVFPDFKNSTVRRVQIGEPALTLKREYFAKGLNDTIVVAYYNYMVDIAVMLGADRERAMNEMNETLIFEMKLANYTTPLEEHRDNLEKFHHPMSISEAQKKYPFFAWLEYINGILAPAAYLNESEVIVINSPNYVGNLSSILDGTPKRVQANYVMWRAVQNSISYLSKEVRDRQLEFGSVMNGKTSRTPRWKECVNLACGTFFIVSGSLYVQKYFQEDSKKEALELVTNIRHEMYEILRKVEWMDEETRKNALEKSYAIENHIAYPDELLDRQKVAEVYKNLTLEPDNYYEMILNVTRFGSDYSFSRLREPVNKTDWKSHSHADTVNAMYSPLQNTIDFPAGILQSVFFSKDRMKYMNYGAIGFIIGHEITHAFDDQGRQFDKDGNLRDWWDRATERRYKEKAKCMVDQYSNYTIDEINVKLNGFNSQGENIADNGGLRESYSAYKKWLNRNGDEPQLPGLAYTNDQMFWISFASVWCSKSREEVLRFQVDTAVHAPNKLRVIGSVSNQPEFSEHFNCPSTCKMNPANKCKVW